MRPMQLFSLFAVLLAFGCDRRASLIAPDGGTGADRGQGGGSAGGAGGSAGDGPALVVALDGEILYVSEDGAEVRTAYRFAPPDIPAGSLSGSAVSVDAHDRHVLATFSVHTFYPSTQDWQQGDRAVLLDEAAHVRWEKSFTAGDLGPGHSRAFHGQVGDAGNAVLTVGWPQLYVAADGGEQWIEGVRAALAPVAGPVVPVVREGATSLDSSFGWWRPGRPADFIGYPLDLPLVASAADARFVFASRDAAELRVLVDARPAGFDVRPWPADIGETITSFGSGAWRADDHGDEVTRWNVLSGEIARLPWALPEGMRRLGSPSLDADGALIVVLRNDYMAAAYRSAVAGPDWLPFGKTMGGVETVAVTGAAGGTYVIDATGPNDWFGQPRQSWQDPPPGQEPTLRGRSHQIVRPADAVAVEVAPSMWTIQLSPDGHRAIYWREEPGGHALVMLDLASAGERRIAFRSLPRAYQLAWNR
jgi:hypothetical protein